MIARNPSAPGSQRGFSLIEIMVGLVIGLIAVLVTYQIFNVSETFKRNTTAVADAQQNGLLSSFLMSLQLSNASNGIASAGIELDACPTDTIANTLRPIPVMITDSGDDMVPDSFVVNYGSTSRLVIPAQFNSKLVAGFNAQTDNYIVQSPTGFFVGDEVVLIDSGGATGAGRCGHANVTSVTPGDTASIAAAGGYVTLTHGNFAGTGAFGLAGLCITPAAGSYCGDSVLLDLGATPQRILYDILNNTLRSTDLLSAIPPVLPVPMPVASNIVNMKVQYGIDTDNDGYADTWVKAVNGPFGDFSPTPAGILSMSYQDMSRIKAIRIALVVKSEQFDQNLGDWSPNPPIFGDCNGYTCPPEPVISYPAQASPPGNFRYRTYQTVVPLRNAIWNVDKK